MSRSRSSAAPDRRTLGDARLTAVCGDEQGVGIGVGAYGRDGERRFRLFGEETSWVANVYGGRAYVGGSANGPLRVVDLATGRVVGERRQPLPWLVQGSASGWWG